MCQQFSITIQSGTQLPRFVESRRAKTPDLAVLVAHLNGRLRFYSGYRLTVRAPSPTHHGVVSVQGYWDRNPTESAYAALLTLIGTYVHINASPGYAVTNSGALEVYWSFDTTGKRKLQPEFVAA